MSFYRPVLSAIAGFGVLNFLALWTFSFVFGDAWFGIVENGHYYLAKHASHQQPIEVTPELFALSLWHVKSQFITVPLAVVASWLLNRAKKHGQSKQDTRFR